jgi:hypothetical protein
MHFFWGRYAADGNRKSWAGWYRFGWQRTRAIDLNEIRSSITITLVEYGAL